MNLENYMLKITYAAVFALALFTFTAFSLAALHHLLIFVPGIYFLIWALKKDGELKLSKSGWALFALIAISILSVLFNFDDIPKPHKNIFKLKYFILSLLGIFAYRRWFQLNHSVKKIRLVINTFLVTTTFASASGLIGLFTGFNPLRFKAACHASRTCGMYGMYMSYGYGIQLFVVIVIGLFIYRHKIKLFVNYNILYIALLINVLGFVLSYARGAYLGLLAAASYVLFRKSKKAFFVIFLLGFVVSWGAYTLVPQVKARFASNERMRSIGIRVSQYKAALTSVADNPLFGIGYKNFEPNSSKIKKLEGIEFSNFGGHGHSNFFEHLASTGILGFMALLLFHFFWFLESYRRQDLFGEILAPFVISLFVSGQFQYTLGDGENLFLIMVLYSLSQVNVVRRQREGI